MIRKAVCIIVIFTLVGGWLFLGWLQIGSLKLRVEKAYAYDLEATYGFDDYSEANNGDWLYESDNSGSMTDVGIADEPTANGNAPQWQWISSGTSASGSTGPPTGNTQSCIFPETSSPVAVGDVAQATLQDEYNASTYGLFVTFEHSTWGNASGTSYFEAWDGTQYNVIASWAGTGDTGWQSRGPYDFSPTGYDYTNSDFHIRFRVVVGGSAYQNDFSFDTVFIYGDNKGVPDAPTLSDVPFDNEKTGDSTPEFKFTADDPDGTADITYHIEIDNDYAFSSMLINCESDTSCTTGAGSFTRSGDSDPFTEGEEVTFTPTTAMTTGTTYYWRVRAEDVIGGEEQVITENGVKFTASLMFPARIHQSGSRRLMSNLTRTRTAIRKHLVRTVLIWDREGKSWRPGALSPRQHQLALTVLLELDFNQRH